MALTINQNALKRVSQGNKWKILGLMSMDSSYPAGGYPIIPAQLGLDQVDSFIVNDNQLGYLFDLDAGRVRVYQGGAGSFVGVAMAPHSHLLSNYVEDITAQPDTFCLVTAATGFFTVGETITGGTSGATATVTSGNGNAISDIGFTPVLGSFTVTETITGGTSGVTATVASGWFSNYRVAPGRNPILLQGATRTTASGRAFSPTSSEVNADLKVYFNTLVGNFADFELITGGTSGATATVSFRNNGSLVCTQIAWPTVGFTVGETITGGTSAATAVVECSEFIQNIVFRPAPTTSGIDPSVGDFICFYPASVNASPMRFTYLGTDSSAAASAGTPSGASSGAPGTEVAPGTNLTALKQLEFEATGL